MVSGDERAAVPEGSTGTGLTVGIVRARWNDKIVERLAEGVARGLSSLKAAGVPDPTSARRRPPVRWRWPASDRVARRTEPEAEEIEGVASG